MEKKWWWKLIFLATCSVLAVVHVVPTVANLDLEKTSFPFKRKINLGLDLQGGLYMVLGVDFNQVYKEVLDRQVTNLESRLKEKEIRFTKLEMIRKGFPADDPRIILDYPTFAHDQLYSMVKEEFTSLRLTKDTKGHYEFGLAHTYRADIREKTINQSIEVIRNRIDEFGVAEPSITSQGNDRVVVELPGVREVERAKKLIGRTAKLEFKMVDDKAMDPAALAQLITQIETDHKLEYKGAAESGKFSDYVRTINEKAGKKLPKGTQIAFERIRGLTGEVTQRVPYLLKLKTEVTGDDLSDAQVAFDPDTRRPMVSFTLNPRGAALFDTLTAAHINERLAIVLDNIVHSAPVIQSRIGGGRGQITLGSGNGTELMKEAKDLAIVLRAGALPAQLAFLEQRVVGPSLGQDSIRLGATAGLLGALAVFLFIAFYYRGSGLIAVVSLLLNVTFVLAILVGLEATLTLPGIAGIALTVGIAVDSNVVIYERIREELRAGKTLGGSIEAGFQKAFRTILDANVTNAAAALVLLAYGTGPIKGFAVTMLIGIITTLFTAVFVCKLFFDLYLRRLEQRQAASLSI